MHSRARLFALLVTVLLAAMVPAAFAGSPSADKVIASAATPNGSGYWALHSSGAVDALSGAGYYGSVKQQRLNKPPTGIAPTPSGAGYWIVAGDGGVFAFGDAGFFGGLANKKANKAIVDIAPTPTGKGYWLTAADGGVFAFGDATFLGSLGSTTLNQPIVGIAATPSGAGYWLVAADGGVFAFGDAAYHGSMAGTQLAAPVVGMVATSTGNGYRLVGGDGGVFAFGDAAYYGSASGSMVAITRNATGGYREVNSSGQQFLFDSSTAPPSTTTTTAPPSTTTTTAPPSTTTTTAPPSTTTTTAPPSTTTTTAPPSTTTTTAPPTTNSGGTSTIVWTGAGAIKYYTSAVQNLKSLGADAWVASTGFLPGMGGASDQQTMYSGLPAQVGQPVFLGVYLTNYENFSSPLVPWNDDTQWSQVVQTFKNLAQFGHDNGWAGLALDHEPYPTNSGKNDNMWTWQSSGLSESTARSLAQQRGRQVMDAITSVWPGVEIINYGARMPNTWDAKVQADVNGTQNAWANWLTTDFWAGMTSGDGWGKVTFLEAIHYKSPQDPGATWDTALSYDKNAYSNIASSRFGHPDRIHWAPFGWIDSDPNDSFSYVRPVDYVTDQYNHFRTYTDQYAGVYDYGLLQFDYSPFSQALGG